MQRVRPLAALKLMRLSKDTLRAYLAMVCCVLTSGTIRLLGHAGPRLDGFAPMVFAGHACSLLIWMRLMRSRIVRREVRWCFAGIAGLMLAWLLVQMVRYEFTAGVYDFSRLLWYGYYALLSGIPPLLVVAVLHVGRREGWRMSASWGALFVVSALLALLVLTNDVHHLAFRFVGPQPDNLPLGGEWDYVHAPVFYAFWVWVGALAVIALVILVRRCVRAGLLRRAVGPVLVLALTAAVLPRYGMQDKWAFESMYTFSETTCMLIVLFMESLVASGLFPVNAGYEALWQASSLRGGFLEEAETPVDLSAGAPAVTPAQVTAALTNPVVLSDGREELVAHRVVGGVAFWVRDLTQVRHLQEQLEQLGDALANERSLLEAENDLVRSREALKQREALYERVAAHTSSQRASLEKALASMSSDDDAFLREMHHAALYATYIKRCANLILLGEDGTIDARELALALEETAACLQAAGIAAEVSLRGAGRLPSDAVLQAYAALQEAVERALPTLCEVRVAGDVAEGWLEVTLDAGTSDAGSTRLALTLGGGAA